MWLVLAMGGIAIFLLASTLTLAVAPVLAFAQRSRSHLARILVAHIREDVPSGFEQVLEPPAERAWTDLSILADSKEHESPDLWAHVVVSLTPNKVAGPDDVARVQHATLNELDREVLRIQTDLTPISAIETLENSGRWLRRAYIRLAWVGLRNHFLPVANSALEIVGLSATSYTVLGLIVSTIAVAIATVTTPEMPDIFTNLGTGATLGAFAGMLIGIARFFLMAKTALSNADASWWLAMVLLGSYLAILVVVAIVLAGSQVFRDRSFQTAEHETFLSPAAFPILALGAGIIYSGLVTFALMAMLRIAIRATSWSQRVVAWGSFISAFLLIGAIVSFILKWQVVASTLIVAFSACAALTVSFPPLMSFGVWVVSRVSPAGRPVYLGLPGIIVVWAMGYIVFSSIVIVAVLVASSWLGTAPSTPVFLGAVSVAVAASVVGGLSHHRRNVYRNSRRNLDEMLNVGDSKPTSR